MQLIPLPYVQIKTQSASSIYLLHLQPDLFTLLFCRRCRFMLIGNS